MKTRTAAPGGPLRQERFASSPRFERGLSANLVALCCSTIAEPSDRAPLWFVQYRSWMPGGLDKLARELLDTYSLADFNGDIDGLDRTPDRAPAALQQALARQCLDPEYGLSRLWEILDDYRDKWIAGRANAVVQTEVGERIANAMRYAREAQTMVLIDGPARLGKTFAAKASCEQSGGLVRYVQVPSATDMASFIRAIAEALGLATNLNLKVQVLQERIRDTLAGGDISLCLDEAHYLWPQGRLRSAVPARVNFVMTEFCNQNIPVPVVLVTTPQFYSAQAQLERQTAWTSEQWVGRLGHVERLPETLSESDLCKVATSLLPSADPRTVSALASYAFVSKKHLASIEAIAKRATWLAREAGRPSATADDVKRAMKESVMPADAALTERLAKAKSPEPPRRRGGFAPYRRPTGGVVAVASSRSVTPTLEAVET
jgi:hypothetical protein